MPSRLKRARSASTGLRDSIQTFQDVEIIARDGHDNLTSRVALLEDRLRHLESRLDPADRSLTKSGDESVILEPIDDTTGHDGERHLPAHLLATTDQPRPRASQIIQPAFVRALNPIRPYLNVPPGPPKTFTIGELRKWLGGSWLYHGVYVLAQETELVPKRFWYAVTAANEPYLPSHVGDHGARLTLFMPPFPDAIDVLRDAAPLFIARRQGEYVYYGTYLQPRYSDRLGYNEMMEGVPKRVRKYWANQLRSKHNGRQPLWAARALKEEGLVGADEPGQSRSAGVSEMEARKAALIKYSDVIRAFRKSDVDTKPSLRLYWEYLQCVGYDSEFYEKLVWMKHGSSQSSS